MTVLSTATRVRAAVDGQLTAECRSCGLHLVQVPDTDVERALEAFDRAHAPGRETHVRDLPEGWRRASPAS